MFYWRWSRRCLWAGRRGCGDLTEQQGLSTTELSLKPPFALDSFANPTQPRIIWKPRLNNHLDQNGLWTLLWGITLIINGSERPSPPWAAPFLGRWFWAPQESQWAEVSKQPSSMVSAYASCSVSGFQCLSGSSIYQLLYWATSSDQGALSVWVIRSIIPPSTCFVSVHFLTARPAASEQHDC